MIKANELRRGNLFHPALGYDDGPGPLTSSWYTVEVIYSDEVGYNSVGHFFTYKEDDIFGVRITAEWLIKLGFIESKSYDSNQRYFKKDGFDQLADYGTQVIILQEGTPPCLSCGYYENTIYIEYVHQLQNLYFALTGEELTVNETA